MNVYVVVARLTPQDEPAVAGVESSEGGAVALAEEEVAAGHEAWVEEHALRGAPQAPPPVRVVRRNGHAPLPLNNVPVAQPVRPPVPGSYLGPNGRWLAPDGSELVVQPGPVPENRLPPGGSPAYAPRFCRTHANQPLDAHGHCKWCQPGSFTLEQVQQWPVNPPAPPTPGAENM